MNTDPRPLYRILSSLVGARQNCINSGNTDWETNHTSAIESLVADILPSGSGVDNGTTINLDKSTSEKLVLAMGFHHMDDNGSYDGWSHHTATVRPSLQFGFTVKIGGRDRNDIKDYLGELYDNALSTPIEQKDGEYRAVYEYTRAV